jgi:hypothetical protein
MQATQASRACLQPPSSVLQICSESKLLHPRAHRWTRRGTVNLDAAKHVIDLHGILQEKTRGNLAPEENTLLDNMLADLRMQFVSASGRR